MFVRRSQHKYGAGQKEKKTLTILKWHSETLKKKDGEKETVKGRKGVPGTQSEISFGVVPVVILRGFPLWATHLITRGLQTLKGEGEEDGDETDVDKVKGWCLDNDHSSSKMMEMIMNNLAYDEGGTGRGFE